MLHVPSVNRGLGILFLCFMEKILGAWPNFKALVLFFAENIYVMKRVNVEVTIYRPMEIILTCGCTLAIFSL